MLGANYKRYLTAGIMAVHEEEFSSRVSGSNRASGRGCDKDECMNYFFE